MGIYDRDYYRAPSGGGQFGAFRMWTITTWLIVVNIAVFLADMFLNGALTDWGAFANYLVIGHWQIWRFITFQFLHATPSHIFFNMLSLYFFGPMIESYLGPRRYLAFYLLCGIGGGLGFILLGYLGFLPHGGGGYLVGASAGIFGILIAAARIAPDTPVALMFLPIPIKLRTMALAILAIAAYTVIASGQNAGGQAAHLGGAVVGFFLIRNERLLDFAQWRNRRMNYGGRRVVYKDWSKDPNR